MAYASTKDSSTEEYWRRTVEEDRAESAPPPTPRPEEDER